MRAIRVKLRAMKTSNLVIPTILLLLGGTAYGSVISANKLAVEAGMPYFAYAFWQMALASAVLLPASVLLRSRPKASLAHLKTYGLVATVGLSGPLLILAFLADKLPPSVLILAVALIAAATYLLALAVRSESFRWLSLLGVALGFGGKVVKVKMDEKYFIESVKMPMVKVVKGALVPMPPPPPPITDEDIAALMAYVKSLSKPQVN